MTKKKKKKYIRNWFFQKMVWNCAVPNCNISGRNNPNKLSCFSIPKDLEILSKWKSILKCNFHGPLARVCEKHFSPDDIRTRLRKEHNGVVVLEVIMFFGSNC